MANFAVAASDEVIAQGKELLEKLKQPDEKQGDVLGRIFRMVSDQQDGETMRQGGIDADALDASLSNIRNMFLTTVTSKEQIIFEKDNKISEIKKMKDQREEDLRNKLTDAQNAKTEAESKVSEAEKTAAQAVKDANSAKEQAATATSLAAEKDKTISTLADKLAIAEDKAKNYDALEKKESEAREKINELMRTISDNQAAAERNLKAEKEAGSRALADAEKDHQTAMRELRAEMERKISDTQKDDALASAKAVADKEREMNEQLRAADKENARLQAQIEILRAQINKLTAKEE